MDVGLPCRFEGCKAGFLGWDRCFLGYGVDSCGAIFGNCWINLVMVRAGFAIFVVIRLFLF